MIRSALILACRILLVFVVSATTSFAQLPSVEWLPNDDILWTYTSYIPEAQAVADSTPGLGPLFNDPTINGHFDHGFEVDGTITYLAVRSESLDVLTSQVVALDNRTGEVEWRYTILPDTSNIAYSVVHIDVRDGLLYVMGLRCSEPINRFQPNCTRVFSNPMEMHVLDAATGDIIDIVNAVEEDAPLEIQYFLSNDRPPIMPRSDGSVFYLRSLDWIRTDYANSIVVSDPNGDVAIRGDTIAYEDRFNRTARLGHAFSDDSALFYYGSTENNSFPNFSEAVVLLVDNEGAIADVIEIDSLTNYLFSLITLDCNDDVCLISGISRFEDDAVQNTNGSYPRAFKVSLLVLDRQGDVVKQYKRIPNTGNGGVVGFMNHQTGQVGFVHRDGNEPGWQYRFDIYLEIDNHIKLVDSIMVDTTTEGVEMVDAVISEDNILSLSFYNVREGIGTDTRHVVGFDLSSYLLTGTTEESGGRHTHLSVVPNSAVDRIELVDVAEGADYRIVDMMGRLLKSGAYEGVINVSSLVPGLYSISVISETGRGITETFVKQ